MKPVWFPNGILLKSSERGQSEHSKKITSFYVNLAKCASESTLVVAVVMLEKVALSLASSNSSQPYWDCTTFSLDTIGTLRNGCL